MTDNFTLIDEGHVCPVSATISQDRVRLSPAASKSALGWEVKPQGLCKDDRCIPATAAPGLVDTDGVDLAAFAGVLARPLAIDIAERVACLGASAADRGAQLASLDAPDFTLPDLSGRQHSLSDYRGKKFFLVAYASW